jgi:MAF protein
LRPPIRRIFNSVPLKISMTRYFGQEYVLESLLMTNLVLASNSPRRRELLSLTGWKFNIQAANIDESQLPGEDPAAYVARLAEEKAKAAALMLASDSLVLGSDTIVVLDGQLLGKPTGPQDAANMLRRLRGRTHQVFTGLSIISTVNGRTENELCVVDVPMREYSDLEISQYIASGDPLDKAGAYAIQNTAFSPVLNLSGCFASVMGLPLCHVARCLNRFAWPLPNQLPGRCQQHLQYHCTVHPQILRPTVL